MPQVNCGIDRQVIKKCKAAFLYNSMKAIIGFHGDRIGESAGARFYTHMSRMSCGIERKP